VINIVFIFEQYDLGIAIIFASPTYDDIYNTWPTIMETYTIDSEAFVINE